MGQDKLYVTERDALFHRKCLEKIRQFRLIDDDFFRVCFQDDIEGVAFILRILMDKNDLEVVSCKTQHSVKNLHGHSVILDVFATDSRGQTYDIEVQRADKGAAPRRARYNSSMIDAQLLLPEIDYSTLPHNYVIFITENDVLKRGLPIYHIDRVILETGENFEDGSHIIYANGAYRSDSALGKLMHDFNCADPNQMNYPLLAKKTRLMKEDTKGVSQMSEIMEEFLNEMMAEERASMRQELAEAKAEAVEAKAEAVEAKAREQSIKSALRMIMGGKLTLEEISEYTSLPLDDVKEYAALTVRA